ncbi:MAG: hypothetical protein ACK559_00875, partial [bacterium]
MSRIWDRHEEARWRGARDNAPERLFTLLADPAPEVGLSLSLISISGYRIAFQCCTHGYVAGSNL